MLAAERAKMADLQKGIKELQVCLRACIAWQSSKLPLPRDGIVSALCRSASPASLQGCPPYCPQVKVSQAEKTEKELQVRPAR